MEKLGTDYGGWSIPIDILLNENSIVYSAGVGEDMSFDLLLDDKYKSQIFLIDPTERAIKHYEETKQYYTNQKLFTGNIQKDYYDKISHCNPNFNNIHYLNIGLWNEIAELKFYKNKNKSYVSQTLIENMFGNEYDTVKVDTIKNIMNQYNHTKIDLLKMDIEGAEVKVLEQMLDDSIFPTYLCIEFDLKLKNKDPQNTTNKIINRLIENGYKILVNDNLNITFIKIN